MAKDKELLFKGKWHKLIRWMSSSTRFLPSSQVKGWAFLVLPLETGSEDGYLKACSGTEPVSLPARFSTSNTEQNPANCRIVPSSKSHPYKALQNQRRQMRPVLFVYSVKYFMAEI